MKTIMTFILTVIFLSSILFAAEEEKLECKPVSRQWAFYFISKTNNVYLYRHRKLDAALAIACYIPKYTDINKFEAELKEIGTVHKIANDKYRVYFKVDPVSTHIYYVIGKDVITQYSLSSKVEKDFEIVSKIISEGL